MPLPPPLQWARQRMMILIPRSLCVTVRGMNYLTALMGTNHLEIMEHPRDQERSDRKPLWRLRLFPGGLQDTAWR